MKESETLEKKCAWKVQVERRLALLNNPKDYVFETQTLNICNKCKGYDYKCHGYLKR
jgi:hypothetical protein